MKKLRLREGKRLTQGHTLFTTTPYCLSINVPLLKSVRACSVFVSNSLKPHELQPARLPCPWDSPGKNTGVGCHFLLQGGSSQSRDQTHVSCISCIGRGILYHWTTWFIRDHNHLLACESFANRQCASFGLWAHLLTLS